MKKTSQNSFSLSLSLSLSRISLSLSRISLSLSKSLLPATTLDLDGSNAAELMPKSNPNDLTRLREEAS